MISPELGLIGLKVAERVADTALYVTKEVIPDEIKPKPKEKPVQKVNEVSDSLSDLLKMIAVRSELNDLKHDSPVEQPKVVVPKQAV